MLAAVITCSDRAVSGAYSDRSGPLLRQALDALGFETRDPRIVPDNLVMIRAAIREAVASGARVVLTTGGTGLSDDDITVDELAKYLTKQLPGIAMQFWQTGLRATPLAVCSRAIAGTVGHTFVMALPGSVSACRDGIKVLDPIIDSLVGMLEGTHVH